jgi:hypothetical protein
MKSREIPPLKKSKKSKIKKKISKKKEIIFKKKTKGGVHDFFFAISQQT